MRSLVCRLVEKMGHSSEVTATAEEALDRIHTTHFDLVITDLHLGKMAGDQLAREIKQAEPGLPVILMTGKPPEEMPGHVDHLLRKPFTLASFSEAVHSFLNLAGLASDSA